MKLNLIRLILVFVFVFSFVAIYSQAEAQKPGVYGTVTSQGTGVPYKQVFWREFANVPDGYYKCMDNCPDDTDCDGTCPKYPKDYPEKSISDGGNCTTTAGGGRPTGCANYTPQTKYTYTNGYGYYNFPTGTGSYPPFGCGENPHRIYINDNNGFYCGNVPDYSGSPSFYQTPPDPVQQNGCYKWFGTWDNFDHHWDGLGNNDIGLGYQLDFVYKPNPTYSWKTGNWGSCNSCSQSRSVWCERDDGLMVLDSYCTGTKPDLSRVNSSDCATNGYWSNFGSCSASSCGTNGTITRACLGQSCGGADCSGLDGGDWSRTCSAPTCPPVNPTNLVGSCNTSYLVSLSWDPVSGATGYPLRIADKPYDFSPPTNPPNCATATVYDGGDVCYDGQTATSFSFTGAPGKTYSWWVHTTNSAGWSPGIWGTDVTCVAPTATPTTAPYLKTSGGNVHANQ